MPPIGWVASISASSKRGENRHAPKGSCRGVRPPPVAAARRPPPGAAPRSRQAPVAILNGADIHFFRTTSILTRRPQMSTMDGTGALTPDRRSEATVRWALSRTSALAWLTSWTSAMTPRRCFSVEQQLGEPLARGLTSRSLLTLPTEGESRGRSWTARRRWPRISSCPAA